MKLKTWKYFSQKLYKPVHFHIITLALPSMIALIAEPLLGLVDTALIGHLGAKELAAMAIVTSFLSSVIWLFNFFISGTTANIAFYHGQKNEQKKRVFYAQSIFFSMVLALLLIFLGILFEPFVFKIMGATSQVKNIASLYYKIRLIGIPFIFSYFIGMGFLRGIKDMKTPMIISVSINLLNGFLDYILIYGIKPIFPGLGLMGAAMATVFSQALASIWYFFILRYKYNVHIQLNILRNLDLSLFKHLVKVNRHLFFRTFFLLFSFTFATAMASRMGDIILGAHQIGIQLWLFLAFLLDSFAIAAQSIAGNFKGKRLPALIHSYGKILIFYGFFLGVFISIILICFGTSLFSLFTNDPLIKNQLKNIYWFIVLYQPMNGLIFLLDGILIGVLDTRFLMIELFVASFIGYIPLAYLSYFYHWGITGIWVGLTVFLGVRLLLNAWRFFTQKYLSF